VQGHRPEPGLNVVSPLGLVNIALASAGPAPADPAPAYPAEAVYSAFTDACADVGDLERATAGLPAKGWEAFTPDPESETGVLVARGKAMVAHGTPDTKLRPMAAFRRTVAGEYLELILSGIETGGRWVNGCRVYDYRETRKIPADFVEKKLDRKPSEAHARPGVLEKAVWEPGYRPDHLSTELFFVPEGSPVIALIGSSGICMVAQAAGER
jgi:hypothetical protein